jgi:hypothetical protein
MRRQLTLFLPPEQRAVVEPFRQRLDPRQHALIPAHVTLCRDDELADWPTLERRLSDLGAFSLTLRFGAPQVLPGGCILLRPTHGAEQYQELRRFLLGSSAPIHGAHVTLLHPRHATGATPDLTEIATALAGLTATIRTIALIEQHDSNPWQLLREYGSAA